MESRSDSICHRTKQAILSVLPAQRIRTLLAYGSMIDGRAENSDVDLYLLLDSWRAEDVDLVRMATRTLPFTTDLALHYEDELPAEPADFTLGTKTCLALTYLASARLLVGENIPRAMYDRVPQHELSVSAAHSITYYLGFLRLKTTCEPHRTSLSRMVDKYLARSAIDAMIFYRKSTYAPFRNLSNRAVMELARDHDPLGSIFTTDVSDERVSTKMRLMQSLHQHVSQRLHEHTAGTELRGPIARSVTGKVGR